MPKAPKPESLAVEDLGDLANYRDDELAALREKLIANEQRIHQEGQHLQRRIKELNQARSDLQHELAENARSMRAVKHQLGQRLSRSTPAPQPRSARPQAAARRAR